LNPKVVVIMIGTNNIGHGKSTPAQTALGVKEIVKQLQAKFANVKILLLGIFPRAAGPDDGARKAVVEATAGFKDAADGVKVHFIDLADKFLNADGTLPKEIMPDLLHLNEKGYQIWADSIEAKVKELMGE
jgi:lysophospholipase L1-like esterase